MVPAARVLTCFAVLLSVLVVAPLAGATTTGAPDVNVTTTAPTIAPDVTVVGIHVGGLTVEEATKVIEDRLVHKMTAPIVVHLGSRTYKLRSGPGKFVMDAARMARSAGRFKPLKPGSTKQRDVGPAIKHSPAAVKAFVAGLVKAIYRAPRSARVKLGITKMKLYRSRGGRTIDTAKTAWLINRALDHLGANRVLRVKTKWIAPAVTPDGLRRRYLHVITVDRGTHTLRLFTKLKLAKRYGVAVGMAGLSTPAGHYAIQDKQVDPAWHVPNSAWAGSLAGQTIPGGAPNNPLKARWMGLADGVGIHGTSEDWSIGSDASHGCIRMHVWDVKELYARVSVGTPVLIR